MEKLYPPYPPYPLDRGCYHDQRLSQVRSLVSRRRAKR